MNNKISKCDVVDNCDECESILSATIVKETVRISNNYDVWEKT